MERTTKVRVTTTRKRTVNFSIPGHRGFCPACQMEVQTLACMEAAEFLGIGQEDLNLLIAGGHPHPIRSLSGSLRVCQQSLNVDGG